MPSETADTKSLGSSHVTWFALRYWVAIVLAVPAAICKCGNHPRNSSSTATVRSIGTGWRLVQAQRAMR
jgi:hypothetical protein